MTARPLVHGTETAYRNRGCRCDECRAGRAARAREYNARKPRKARKPRPRKPIVHGSIYAYTTYQCRCDECRAGRAAYQRDYRARLAAGTVTPATHRGQRRLAPAPAPIEGTDLAAVTALLESRARALALPAAGRGALALEARTRRAEVLALQSAIAREVTA